VGVCEKVEEDEVGRNVEEVVGVCEKVEEVVGRNVEEDVGACEKVEEEVVGTRSKEEEVVGTKEDEVVGTKEDEVEVGLSCVVLLSLLPTSNFKSGSSLSKKLDDCLFFLK